MRCAARSRTSLARGCHPIIVHPSNRATGQRGNNFDRMWALHSDCRMALCPVVPMVDDPMTAHCQKSWRCIGRSRHGCGVSALAVLPPAPLGPPPSRRGDVCSWLVVQLLVSKLLVVGHPNLPPPRGGCRRSRLGEYCELFYCQPHDGGTAYSAVRAGWRAHPACLLALSCLGCFLMSRTIWPDIRILTYELWCKISMSTY